MTTPESESFLAIVQATPRRAARSGTRIASKLDIAVTIQCRRCSALGLIELIKASIPAVLRTIQCIDITELKRPDNLLGWRFLTTENPVEQRAIDALPSRPGRLAAGSLHLPAKQANDIFVVEHAHTAAYHLYLPSCAQRVVKESMMLYLANWRDELASTQLAPAALMSRTCGSCAHRTPFNFAPEGG
jgi:hypothetical protein